MSRPQHPDAAPVRAEDQVSEGGEEVLVFPLGHQQLLEQAHQRRRGPARQDQGPPGHPQADPDSRLGRAVPADVTDDRVHDAVRRLDHVVEVAAEQGIGPAGTVPGDHLERAGADQRGGQQRPLQPGVLLRPQRAALQRRRRLLHVLALGGVADGPAEDVRRRLALDQVVLGAGGDRGEPGALLGEPGQHHHRRARRGGEHLGDRLQPLHVGQVQVEQDAAGRLPRFSRSVASASERTAVSEACMPLSASSSSTSRTSPASSSTRRIVSGSPSHARRAGSRLLLSCGGRRFPAPRRLRGRPGRAAPARRSGSACSPRACGT